MNSRDQLLQTLALADCPPPGYENDFHEDVIANWESTGKTNGNTIAEYFTFDRREDLPVRWRPPAPKNDSEHKCDNLKIFRNAYDPQRSNILPPDWNKLCHRWSDRQFALSAAPWNEGLLQVIGVGDWQTFDHAIDMLATERKFVSDMMNIYADYLIDILENRILPDVDLDFVFFYEAIASNHAPVISPDMYARHAAPALRRVNECLDRHGIHHRFMWSSGRIHELVPHWINAGINGLHISQRGACGVSYLELRREFGADLRFFGGVDSRTLILGTAAIDRELTENVRPLLEQGGYVPYLDDRIRPYVPFENFKYYRRRLNELIHEVFNS